MSDIYAELDGHRFTTPEGLQDYYAGHRMTRYGQWEFTISFYGNEYSLNIPENHYERNFFALAASYLEERGDASQLLDPVDMKDLDTLDRWDQMILAMTCFSMKGICDELGQDPYSAYRQGYVITPEEQLEMAERCADYDLENGLENKPRDEVVGEYQAMPVSELEQEHEQKYGYDWAYSRITAAAAEALYLPRELRERSSYFLTRSTQTVMKERQKPKRMTLRKGGYGQ